MIGGYIYSRKDVAIDARLRNSGLKRLELVENGYLFYTDPFHSNAKVYAASGGLIALSEDLLVLKDGSGAYRAAYLGNDFLSRFRHNEAANSFDSIHSDFRMAVLSSPAAGRKLYLASNRAGSGRIYYHKLKDGIVFCSDLRFLLKIAPLEVSGKALYSLLKYGCILEPLTVAENVYAVPAAHYLKYSPESGDVSLAPYFKYQFPADKEPAQLDEQKLLGGVREVLRGTAAFLARIPSAMLLSGGIDSSLYGCYLNQEKPGSFRAFYCSFGQEDPEYQYACTIAAHLGVKLNVATMEKADAMRALDDVACLTDHPFSDFSSLPIAFLLRYIRDHQSGESLIVECNGGDDCFGFPALTMERKFKLKHSFPGIAKKAIAKTLVRSSCWKWESSEGFLGRVAALADVHERSHLNYFLVQAPLNYLGIEPRPDWDDALQDTIENTAANCVEGYSGLGYGARTTIRQLFYVNSSRWASKALSIGESLGERVVYPYIWRDVLIEQGKLPWSAKVHNGVIKWPLKRLLEEHMPPDFIYRKKSGFVPPFVHWLTDSDFNGRVRGILSSPHSSVGEIVPVRVLNELLEDARKGKQLRSPILSVLWGALFAESWINLIRDSKFQIPDSRSEASAVNRGTSRD